MGLFLLEWTVVKYTHYLYYSRTFLQKFLVSLNPGYRSWRRTESYTSHLDRLPSSTIVPVTPHLRPSVGPVGPGLRISLLSSSSIEMVLFKFFVYVTSFFFQDPVSDKSGTKRFVKDLFRKLTSHLLSPPLSNRPLL